MGYHHLALATRDLKATHEFYTAAMGFTLVKVAVGPAGKRGFAKHLFYDTGNGELIAFWDLHDPDLREDWNPAIATGLGLPVWTNHVAFHADDRAELDRRREHWLAHGVDVMEVDHGWCVSIYATDPNGILVEFCATTDPDFADRAEAERLLADPAPPLDPKPATRTFRASDYRRS
jgi:catechol 2,3-dioxygenase-like lactoylglutathione lyase family enzyme